MPKYVMKDVITNAGGSPFDGNFNMWYFDFVEFEAPADKNAVEFAETVQSQCDKRMDDWFVKHGYELSDSRVADTQLIAPCYLSNLYRFNEDGEAVRVIY